MKPVSRAYEKLNFAIDKFGIDVSDKVCADFGSSTGGFVQVLLERGCKKVYSVETSKNRLHFVLKDDVRVVIMDKTNALHVKLPEKVDFISIDVGWTPQKLIIPNAVRNLKDDGLIVSLVKPHYEERGSLAYASDEKICNVLDKVMDEIKTSVKIVDVVESPLLGLKGKNREFLVLMKKKL